MLFHLIGAEEFRPQRQFVARILSLRVAAAKPVLERNSHCSLWSRSGRQRQKGTNALRLPAFGPVSSSLNLSPVLGGLSDQVCRRGLEPALRLAKNTVFETGTQANAHDYILGLPFDRSCEKAVRNSG